MIPLSANRDHELPLSNQTSIVSFPFTQIALSSSADFPSASDGGIKSDTGPSHQYCGPFSSRTDRIWSSVSGVRITSLLGTCVRDGMGTPHTRWREMHHSERERTKASSLFRATHCQELCRIHEAEAYIQVGRSRSLSKLSKRRL